MENMAYMGTMVTRGSGIGIVVGTGMKTAMGQIADLLQSAETMVTPLQRRLEQLGKILHCNSSSFNSTGSCSWNSSRS